MRVRPCSAVILLAVALLPMPFANADAASPGPQATLSDARAAPGNDRGAHKPAPSHAVTKIATCNVVGNDRAGAPAILSAGQTTGACPAMQVRIGQSSQLLTGPWRFHPGDDLRWAAPDFGDLRWETVDLTPVPGAHDSDVGLTNYVPGWRARGHGDYAGYAWYRMHVSVDAPAGTDVALLAPRMSRMPTSCSGTGH